MRFHYHMIVSDFPVVIISSTFNLPSHCRVPVVLNGVVSSVKKKKCNKMLSQHAAECCLKSQFL